MRLKSTLLVALSALSLLAATDDSDRWYDAIRNNNPSALSALVRNGDMKAKDKHGHTALMYAAAFGTVESMRVLLDGGADVNAKSSFDATALHFAADNLDKVKLLIAKGADVNVVSKQGRTPLLVAASVHGTAPVVKYLLDHGATVDPKNPSYVMSAAIANDVDVVRLLVEKGADFKSPDMIQITPLMTAAGSGNLAMAKLLLSKGADVNHVMPDNPMPPTKNGRFSLGSLTALHGAAAYGGPEMIRLLVDAGAKVDAKDVRGMTPLMLAIATDRANPETVRVLLEKGADPEIKDAEGRSAKDWARKYNNAPVLAALGMQPAPLPEAILIPSAAPKSDVKAAVAKSIALLQATNKTFMSKGGCGACHSQNMTAIAAAAAQAHGVPVDQAAETEQLKGTAAFLAGMEQFLMQHMNGGPGGADGTFYTVLQLEAGNMQPSRTTDLLAYSLFGYQEADGGWHGGGLARAPMEDSDISRTGLALHAMKLYRFPGRDAEFESRIQRGADFLRKATPVTTEDRLMMLIGLDAAGASQSEKNLVVNSLLNLQRPDGGWGQTPGLASDAYATGQALYALHLAGWSAAEEPYQRGVRFLLRTQKDDGSWFVPSRAPKFQPYFESGFPHGHDQWISTAATSWAATALAYAVPEEPKRTASLE